MGKQKKYEPQFTAVEGEEAVNDSLREKYETFIINPEALNGSESLNYANPSPIYKVRSRNTVATILRVIGIIIYVSGFIAGVFLGEETAVEFVVVFFVWAASFISGTIFIGFAEIIKILQQISDKLK